MFLYKEKDMSGMYANSGKIKGETQEGGHL
jgi:hypothetical protein